MEDDYICNDNGVLENVENVRNMTDEEFEKYMEELKDKAKAAEK